MKVLSLFRFKFLIVNIKLSNGAVGFLSKTNLNSS